jgi:hypothetical protein
MGALAMITAASIGPIVDKKRKELGHANQQCFKVEFQKQRDW